MKRPRIGVYICHCGTNIASYVDVKRLVELIRDVPDVVVARDYRYMCSEPGQELIRGDLRDGKIDRVVVGACSPNLHERTFRRVLEREGLNPFYLCHVSIRENCSWVHDDKESATKKAYELVMGGIWRVRRLEPLTSTEIPIEKRVLIIGGGVSGITAAIDILDAGFDVVLVEKEDHLGGWVRRIWKGFPNLDPLDEFIESRIKKLLSYRNVKIYTSSTVSSLEGFFGSFKVKIKSKSGDVFEETVGSIIVAAGFKPFDASRKPEFGYGRYDNVLTTVDLEALFSSGKIRDLKPKSVAFIQCVGSRDKVVGNDYCSRVCCMTVLKQAYLLKELVPDVKIYVFYMDVRSFCKGCEEFYENVQRKGVLYIRGNPSEIYKKGNSLFVRFEDTLLGGARELEVDLVVLAVGMEPPQDSHELSSILGLQRDRNGFFLEAHPKLGPLDTYSEGIFIAGCCQGPKDIPDSISQAHGAAARATLFFHKGKAVKEPIVARVDEDICSGCRLCEGVCSFGALEFDPKRKVMTVKEAACKGCGACSATCPSSAISLNHYKSPQVITWVEGILVS